LWQKLHASLGSCSEEGGGAGEGRGVCIGYESEEEAAGELNTEVNELEGGKSIHGPRLADYGSE
jgi:hypothetical protein